jgi:hypothetical protein
MLCSALFQRTQQATVIAYAIVLVLTVGTYIGWGVWTAIRENQSGDRDPAPTWVLVVNPVTLLADVVGTDSEDSDTPLGSMRDALYPEDTDFDLVGEDVGFAVAPGGMILGGDVIVDEAGNPVPIDPLTGEPIDQVDLLREDDGSFWKQSLVALTVIAVLSLVVATRRVRTPREVER